MNRTKWSAIVLFVFTFAAMPVSPQSSGQGNRGTMSPAWPALMESVKRMHAAMISVGPSLNSDVDFVILMLPHHQAAIDMARAQLMYGKDPQMRRLAQEIITDQQAEIELMQLWLKQHEISDGPTQAAPAKKE
jgi:uncharacterized protein (DUF305 family)